MSAPRETLQERARRLRAERREFRPIVAMTVRVADRRPEGSPQVLGRIRLVSVARVDAMPDAPPSMTIGRQAYARSIELFDGLGLAMHKAALLRGRCW